MSDAKSFPDNYAELVNQFFSEEGGFPSLFYSCVPATIFNFLFIPSEVRNAVSALCSIRVIDQNPVAEGDDYQKNTGALFEEQKGRLQAHERLLSKFIYTILPLN